jgi:hypothetical protein
MRRLHLDTRCMRIENLDTSRLLDAYQFWIWGDSFQRDFMNAGLQTLVISVQCFNDDLSRAAIATDSLVAADSTVDSGQEESGEELSIRTG